MFGWRERTLILSLSGLLAASAATQDPTRPDRPTTRPGDTTTTPSIQRPSTSSANDADSVLATWLLVDNQKEVELAQIAQERAKNEEVKQFAKRMADEHRSIVTKLQKFASGTGIGTGTGTGMDRDDGRDPTGTGTRRDPADATGRRDTGATGQTDPTRPDRTGQDPTRPGQDPTRPGQDPTRPGQDPTRTGQPGQIGNQGTLGQQAGKPLDFVALTRDLGRECLATARRELEQKSGAEFDKCYMAMQVAAHMAAVDKLEVFRNYASGELRQTIMEGLPTVQAHLEHAKNVMQKLEGTKTGEKLGN